MGEEENNHVIELEHVVFKFAGDSGDGMQLTGTQFTETSAMIGNDIATYPDYPAEIRAPEGTVAGVSGFQVHIGKRKVYTPGDLTDVLIAMNPAALKANLELVKKGATVIVDTNSFDKRNLEKAGFQNNPLKDGSLKDYFILEAPITSMTKECIKELGLDNKEMIRCKNMFALGVVYWLFNRPLEVTQKFLDDKFKNTPTLAKANKFALNAGYNYAENIEALISFTVLPAEFEKGVYRNITGNIAVAWGLIAAAQKAGTQLFLGSYPITPASEIMHELSRTNYFGAKVFQAEDEIAGICSAIGASFTGALGITTTSGPGLSLQGEAIGLAIIAELPLVIIDVQRSGPSTGMPTKSEQGDLLQALFGRHGESPVVVLAASTPANCFEYAFHAAKIALEHLTPVILLTDGFLGFGSEPWRIKPLAGLPEIKPPYTNNLNGNWKPYLRNPDSMVRYWVVPGMKDLQHRIGSLEKQDITGDVSHDPLNHEKMVIHRSEKIKMVVSQIPDLKVEGAESGDLLVVGWGGTYGHLYSAFDEMLKENSSIGFAHFNYINPLPKNTGEVFSRYKKIVVCELNLGQFAFYLRSMLPHPGYLKYNKIQGQPFTVMELVKCFKQILNEKQK